MLGCICPIGGACHSHHRQQCLRHRDRNTTQEKRKKPYNPLLNPLESGCYKNQGHSAMNWTIFTSGLCRASGWIWWNSEVLWQRFHLSHCLHLSLEKHILHWGCAEPKQICVYKSTFDPWKAQIITVFCFCFFFCYGFPSSKVRGCDMSLRWGLYWHINGVTVCGELGLTQSEASELITTSLWAKNSKGFLAYHCFNYRGGKDRGHHTAVWLYGRKRPRLTRNNARGLQGIYVQ